jgi:hypothetical protein
MGWLKDLLRGAFAPSSPMDMFGGSARDALRALNLIERMPLSEAVPMLLDGVRQHPSDEVRGHCIRTLLPYDLDDGQIKVVAAALDHPSAKVRHTAVSFFGLRGSQKRPVTNIVPKLMRMLEEPNDSTRGDPLEEMVAKTGLPMTIAAALKTTIGAEKLMPNYESPDLAGFRRELDQLRNDNDATFRSDAEKYLRVMFAGR